ncbi:MULTISPECIES: aspartyl protease [Microcystis]|jgi:clan AA aspartic protease|nr:MULTISPECIES: aspartyl protease [Microcystis]MCZ8361338.1 clan AA aspartic protease [Microcystis sp. LE19-251.1A]MDJ0524753.1 clan AA aspartic protease [Microcystis sp. M53600_WE12]MDJ0543386.1 clan AA aspartic protease [Microcystis sp. M53601_WE4]NCR82149.1 clan AA aspartic protease [Microcystis aeruginosa K13-10]NCR86842.1 clan AA aspartic protease [Microcystis aeruginosa K13-05]
MMQGRVNQGCEATLAIAVRNNETTQIVDAVIDTGFSGFLTLPSDIIARLGFIWEGRDLATLGDGTFCTFEVYIGLVIWDGQYREIYINESETVPLIGMQLLRGYDLRIQAIEGGLVTIEALK